MIEAGFSVFRNKRVLLLQGPLGPFFRRLSTDLEQAGARVFKVNFNGGDWLFYRDNAFNYRGKMADWPAYLEALLDQLRVDVVMLFGDCRQIHLPVHEITQRRGVEMNVFEEGYLRPDYVTLERHGVNGHSAIPRSPIFYLNQPTPPITPPMRVGNAFWPWVKWTILYYLASGLLKPFFWHYRHHRPLTWFEGLPWVRSAWRKFYYSIKERKMFARLTGELSGRFYLMPLQVYNDSQIVTHSDFDTIAQFIDGTMKSFARHAPRNTILVIKHHPMDRGYSDYTRLIAKRAKQLRLKGRCFYIHDQHLPTLLKHTRGVVVVNSTVGLAALLYDASVKVCGRALYNMQGLTFQEPLAVFWRKAHQHKPDHRLLTNFRNYLVNHTQLNGSFYKRLPSVVSATGLRWTSKVIPHSLKQEGAAAVKSRKAL